METKLRVQVNSERRSMWLILALILCLVPTHAYAWAPATHLFFAKEVLSFSYLLPETVRELLTAYRPDYFYGCIAADITLGKAYVEYIYNCHNFDVGLGLLEHAKNPAERAFVYGYVSHLAADTVSHNFFVPYQNIQNFDTSRFKHAYWEVRLDDYFGDRVWDDVESVIKNPRTHSHDHLLDSALKDTIFSFRTNKILFSSMIAIQRLKKWQAFVNTVNKKSKRQFNPQHLAEYNRLAVSAIIRLLSDGKKAPVYKVDPTGAKVLEETIQIREMLKKLKRRGELTKTMHEEECQRFRAHVRSQYFDAYPIEDKDFHPSIQLKL
jgi:hypothetical protein